MKRPKFAHKAPDPEAAEPFDSAEEALHHLHPKGFLPRRHRPAPQLEHCGN